MSVSLEKEYDMLVSELRQNRVIQMQTFLATPIWVSLFLGLLGVNDDQSWSHSELFLLPVPLIFIGFLLILDRRKSSDIIIAYLRTAIDQGMASKPGWNFLLPEFRKALKALDKPSLKKMTIPQRIDFNILVWLSYIAVSLICIALYMNSGNAKSILVIIIGMATLLAYIAMLIRMIFQSAKKDNYLQAWEIALNNRVS